MCRVAGRLARTDRRDAFIAQIAVSKICRGDGSGYSACHFLDQNPAKQFQIASKSKEGRRYELFSLGPAPSLEVSRFLFLSFGRRTDTSMYRSI